MTAKAAGRSGRCQRQNRGWRQRHRGGVGDGKITSVMDESLKKGASLLPLEVVAVRRFRFWETSARLFPENDEWMPTTVDEEWRLAGAPLAVRCLFLGPARIIFQRIRESERSEENSSEIGFEDGLA